MNAWGLHTLYNLYRCNPYTIRCPTRIASFSKALVEGIDMVPYGKPLIQHFGTGNKAGYSLVQLIETSNITAHFVEEDNSAYIDIFSCKEYDPIEAEKIIMSFFQPHNIDTITVPRQAKAKMM